jgi:hypothetical protein
LERNLVEPNSGCINLAAWLTNPLSFSIVMQEIRRILFPAPKAEPTPESKKAEAEAAAALKAEEARKAVASKNKTTPKQRRELEAAKVAKEVEDNARRKREEDALKVSPELEASLTTEMDALRREKDALLAQCLVYLSQAKDLMDELRVPGQLGLEVVFNRARAYFMSNNMVGQHRHHTERV